MRGGQKSPRGVGVVTDVKDGDGTAQRGDDAPSGPGLAKPSPRDAGHSGGTENPIVGVVGIATDSIGAGQRGAVSELGQEAAGEVDQFGVNIDAGDVAGAKAVAQQRGEVTGAGADLQNAAGVGDREFVKHTGGEAGLDAGAGGLSGRVVWAGEPEHPGLVAVGEPQPVTRRGVRVELAPSAADARVEAGQEVVSGNRGEGLVPGRVIEEPGGGQLVEQVNRPVRRMRPGRCRTGHPGGSRRSAEVARKSSSCAPSRSASVAPAYRPSASCRCRPSSLARTIVVRCSGATASRGPAACSAASSSPRSR